MATRTIADGGGNWSSDGTWVEGTAPTASDAVVATGTSGNVTIDTTTCVCSTMVLTNYVGTMTFTAGQKLTVTTTVTFVAGMTLSGTGTLQLSNTATITSGGLTFPGSIIFDGGVWTLADNWTVTNSITIAASSTLNGNTLYVGGSLTTNNNVGGTTSIILNGTGTIGSKSQYYVGNNLTINTAGTITLAQMFGYNGTGAKAFTYTAGTVDAATNNSTLYLLGNVTLNLSGVTWNKISVSAGSNYTFTLLSDLVCSSTFWYYQNSSSANRITFSGNYDISVGILRMDYNTGLDIVSGQSLNISTGIEISSRSYTTNVVLKAVTGSSHFHLNYSGLMGACVISSAIFTDVDASGSSQVIPNYNGGTLTRCTNITNYTAADLAINGFPAATHVYAGTDRGDGTVGTLHASNISTAVGGGSNLSAGILKNGEVVDDVEGTYTGSGGGGMGGIFQSIIRG